MNANAKVEIIQDEDYDAISLDGGKHWRYFVKDTRTTANRIESVFVLEQEGHPEDAGDLTGIAYIGPFPISGLNEDKLANTELSRKGLAPIKRKSDEGFLTTIKPSDWQGKVS